MTNVIKEKKKSKYISTTNISKLSDLHRLGKIIENTDSKVNISELARRLSLSRATVKKYLQGFKKSTTRNKKSSLDKYTSQLLALLEKHRTSSNEFFYISDFYQYSQKIIGFSCQYATFRQYIRKNSKLNGFFRKEKGEIQLHKRMIKLDE
ncbi:MAG: hypothetical protein ACI4V7_02080 [Succinivibrionaceae bacterium]